MRLSNACRILACIGIWAVLEGCGSSQSPPEHAFFPLAAGSHWQYRIERTTMDGVSELRYAIYTVSPDVGAEQATAVRETMDGRRYYYAPNADVGNTIGRTNIEVMRKKWFAPHIGLVRLERTEHSTSDALNYGALRMELDRWWTK